MVFNSARPSGKASSTSPVRDWVNTTPTVSSSIAEKLAIVPGFKVDLRTVETNMVFVSTRPSGRRAAEVAKLFSEAGALCLAESPWRIRFVTHLDVDDADVAEAGEVVARTMAALV